MNKLNAILTFITVVEENHFAKASRKLGVSTAAISRQIAALEKALGVLLLKRTTRQLTLTDTGAAYFEECKKVVAALNEAEENVIGSQKEATGLLQIMSSRYFAEKKLLPKLKAFMAENPKLRLKMDLAERFPNLREENIDIIFGVSLEGPAHYIQRRVATTRYVFCASFAYLKKYGTPKTLEDIKQHAYITHSMRAPDNVITFGDKAVLIEPLLSFNDCAAMLQAAIDGLGIVRLHDYIVEEALAKKQLIEILPNLNKTAIPVYLYYEQNKYLQPKIRKFIDFFVGG